MKILHLTLKKKWFDMIAAGIKKEEYRELKPFWAKRLANGIKQYLCPNCLNGIGYDVDWKQFDAVRFARGGHFHERIPQMLIECNGIEIGTGKSEWGAVKDVEYFKIKLGNIIT